MNANQTFTQEELDQFRAQAQTAQPQVEKPKPVETFSIAQQWGFFGFGVVVWLLMLVTAAVWAKKTKKVWRLVPLVFVILTPFILLIIFGDRIIPG